MVAEPLSRDAVIKTARDLIMCDGLDALSLRRISASLEVSPPALYAYVSDKRDLLVAVAEGEFEALAERYRLIDDPDPVERTRKFARAYVDHARQNPELWKTMFLFQPDLGVVPSNPDQVRLPAAMETFERPTQAIIEAVEAGAIRKQDPIIASLTMWCAVHGLATALLMGFDMGDLEDPLIDSVIETTIRGL
jgi:AcrR family transcriptional regulator